MSKTIGERLEAIKEHFHLSNRKLAQIAGISGQGIADIVKGASKNPRNTIFVKVSDQLGVNLNWLLTGKGSMMKPTANTDETSVPTSAFIRLPFRPMGVHTSALLTESRGESSRKDTYPVLGRLAKLYRQPEVMQVRGDSMEPELKHGDMVLVVPISQAEWPLMGSGLYIVAFPPDQFALGRLVENTISETGKLVLHPENARHGKVTVAAEHLTGMWQIRRLLDRDL